MRFHQVFNLEKSLYLKTRGWENLFKSILLTNPTNWPTSFSLAQKDIRNFGAI